MNTTHSLQEKKSVTPSRLSYLHEFFLIQTLIFYHENGCSRSLRNVDGPLPRCTELHHIILYYSSILIPKFQFLISAYNNLFTTENILLKEHSSGWYTTVKTYLKRHWQRAVKNDKNSPTNPVSI